MPVRPQTYHRPETLADAWQALQTPDTHPWAAAPSCWPVICP
jgi:hypothetical protein